MGLWIYGIDKFIFLFNLNHLIFSLFLSYYFPNPPNNILLVNLFMTVLFRAFFLLTSFALSVGFSLAVPERT